MALARGATNVLFLLQKYSIFPPFACHLIVDALWRIRQLDSNWEKNKDIVQLSTLLILLAFMFVGYTFYYYFKHFNEEFAYVVTQLYQQLGMVKNSTDDRRITSVSKLFGKILCLEKSEAVVFMISFSFLCIPVAAPCLPFVTEFEPLQVLVQELLTFIPSMNPNVACMISKTFAMFIYTFYALHGGAVVLYLLLVFIFVGGCVLHLSTRLKREANVTINQEFIHTSRALNKFQKCIERYRILQILTSISRQISKDIFGALSVMGAVLAASSAYFVIYLYKLVPFIMYLACAVTVVFVFFTCFVLVTLASLPNAHTSLFKQRWRWIRLSKKFRLQLESCGPVGFSLGTFVRIATVKTAIVLADTFLNSIATMVLMGDFQPI
ncbi:unnamed protein product [Orchesella dallaii]|uniref:Odorant receptor n=1 Tax=Orchesella dallaii TaxID=48710 RepID=A0ABP1R6E4_9HEXA